MGNIIDIKSVLIYMTIFAFSLLLVIWAENLLYRNNKLIKHGHRKDEGIVLLFIAILFPCIFAAIRGLNVGVDIDTYIDNNFAYAKNNQLSFVLYWNSMPVQTEPLFALLIYMSAKNNSIHLLFFIIEFLVMMPMSYVVVKQRGKGSLLLSFSAFFLLFYNISLCVMRQFIAMGFFLLGIHFVVEKKWGKAVFYLLIAQLFHSSIVLVLVICIGCFYICKSKHKKEWILFLVICGSTMIVAITVFEPKLISIVSKINPRYGYYIRKYFHQGYRVSDVPTTDLFIKTLLSIIPCCICKRKNRYLFHADCLFHTDCFFHTDCLFLLVCIGRYFVVFNGVFFESMRIAYYFDYFIILYISRSIGFLKKSRDRVLFQVLFVALMFFYWIYYIMYIGGYGTNIVEFNL